MLKKNREKLRDISSEIADLKDGLRDSKIKFNSLTTALKEAGIVYFVRDSYGPHRGGFARQLDLSLLTKKFDLLLDELQYEFEEVPETLKLKRKKGTKS